MTSDNKPKEPQQSPAEAEDPKAPASQNDCLSRDEVMQKLVAAKGLCDDLVDMMDPEQGEGLTREEAIKLSVSMRTKCEGLEAILEAIHANGPQQARPDPEFPPRLSLAQSEQLLHMTIASCAMLSRQAEEKLAELQQKGGTPLLKLH